MISIDLSETTQKSALTIPDKIQSETQSENCGVTLVRVGAAALGYGLGQRIVGTVKDN